MSESTNESPVWARHDVRRRDGEQRFTYSNSAASMTLSEFWSWSASDLLSNTLRGQLAEFIVGSALGCTAGDDVRREWDAFDLLTPDGVRIEVKSTAYLQSWGPTKPQSRRFTVSESYSWDARTNTYATERRRPSDVYVFCVHTVSDPAIADPLALDQWEFFVVPTARINQVLAGQRTVALSVLPRALGVTAIAYPELADAVRAL